MKRMMIAAAIAAAGMATPAAAFTQSDLTAACSTVWGTDADTVELCRQMQMRAAQKLDRVEGEGQVERLCRTRHGTDAVAVLTCASQQAAAIGRLDKAYEKAAAVARKRFDTCFDAHQPDVLAVEFCVLNP